ncbi:MAG: SRPBCC family protein, partial [Pseudomonadota bacterium]
MKLKKIAGVAACGLAVLTASTFALPRHVSVERSALLNASPEAILALAASNEGYQAFNPYRSMDPALTIEPFGPSSGVGSGFHFSGKDGTGHQTVAAVTSDRVSYDVDLGPLGQPKQFISTQALPQGAQVTWRLEADMGFNPVFRVMGLFMDSMVGPT